MRKVKISISVTAEVADYLKDNAEMNDRSVSWVANKIFENDKALSEKIQLKGGSK